MIIYSIDLNGQNKSETFQSAFDENHLNKIDILFDQADWKESLLINDTELETTISINGKFQMPVKIARKGNSSINNTLNRGQDSF